MQLPDQLIFAKLMIIVWSGPVPVEIQICFAITHHIEILVHARHSAEKKALRVCRCCEAINSNFN